MKTNAPKSIPPRETPGSFRAQLRLFGSIRGLAVAALLTALSFVFAVLAKHIFGTGPYRITFENLPIFLGSFAFGPLVGSVIALAVDLISCLDAGMAPSPLIAGGAVLAGLSSGICYRLLKKAPLLLRVTLSVLAGHVLGSMLLKSIGLYFYYGPAVFLRIPIYLLITALESAGLYILLRHKAVQNLLRRIFHDK